MIYLCTVPYVYTVIYLLPCMYVYCTVHAYTYIYMILYYCSHMYCTVQYDMAAIHFSMGSPQNTEKKSRQATVGNDCTEAKRIHFCHV